MSKRFTKVYSTLWRSARFRSLTSDAKLLHLYYLTSDHQSSIGAYEIPDQYAIADLDWDQPQYEMARAELEEAGLIVFDRDTSTVFVVRWFKHSPPMNESHAQGCMRLLAELESESVAEAVQQEFDQAEGKRKVTVMSPTLRAQLGRGR